MMTKAERVAERTIDEMVRTGQYRGPEPTDDLSACIRIGRERLVRAKSDERSLIERYVREATTLLTPR